MTASLRLGDNEALASGVAKVASVAKATEEHSQANANRSRESAIAKVKRLCELRDAKRRQAGGNAAISMALGCSIVGPVDPKEVIRIADSRPASIYRRRCQTQTSR